MKVYVHKDGKQYGPYTVEQLRHYVRQGNFTTADHACHDGQNWVTIADVPGFAEATRPTAVPSPTAPRQDQVVQEKAVDQQPSSTDASNPASKKKKIILWASIGGVAALLVTGLLIWLPGNEDDPATAADEGAMSVSFGRSFTALMDGLNFEPTLTWDDGDMSMSMGVTVSF